MLAAVGTFVGRVIDEFAFGEVTKISRRASGPDYPICVCIAAGRREKGGSGDGREEAAIGIGGVGGVGAEAGSSWELIVKICEIVSRPLSRDDLLARLFL